MSIQAKKSVELAAAAFVAALFSGSVAHVAVCALGISVSAARLYLAALCASVPVAVCFLHKWAGVVGLCCGAFLLAATFRNEAAAALSALSAQSPSLADWGPFAAAAGTVLLALIMFALCRSRGGAFAALALCVIVLVMAWQLDADFSVWRAFPALVAVSAMLAGDMSGASGLVRALVPSALIAALVATMLVPGGRVVYPPLENAAQTVRALFEDYFRFTHSRVAYSLYIDGYKPLGETLGGPASPDAEPIMRVETDEDAIYLRGSIRATYTGWSWTDDSVKNRYLFVDPIRLGVRAEVFETRVDAAEAFREAQASVEFLAEGTSTIFVPHRVTDISAPVSMAMYFNTAGEVFMPRTVEPGDAYSFTALVPVADEEALLRLSGATASDSVDSAYTQLPAAVDARVYELAASLTAGLQNDYDKAAAIRDYLRSNYGYTLNGAYVDQSRDFVSAFLFDLREGYCTYFASAMAVLARAAGLESRYVEGYRVAPNDEGIALVTGADAHAWAEIHIEGLGWMAFDATPGTEARQGGDGTSSEPTPPTATPAPEEPTPSPAGETGIPTPTPPQDAAESTPTPSPGAGDLPTPTPSPGAGDLPAPSPSTGTGVQEPDPSSDDSDNDPPDDDSRAGLAWLWWLLVILALLALLAFAVWRRLAQSDPVRAAANVRDKDLKLLIWYRALLGVFASEGQFPDSGESPALFARRMRAAGLATESFERFADAVMTGRYAGRPATAEQLEYARLAYAELVAQLRPAERARWLRMRMFQGLGDLKHIP